MDLQQMTSDIEEAITKKLANNWHKHFDQRQLNEIEFSRIYAVDFQHGTDGHNTKLIIALMASILNSIEEVLLSDSKPHHKVGHIEELMRVVGNDKTDTN